MTDLAHALRRHRLSARLTQEGLAEAAGLGVRTVRDLERGAIARPRPETVRRLATALRLAPAQRDELIATARSTRIIASAVVRPGPGPRGLPRDLPDFVGRQPQVDLLARGGRDRPMLVHGPPGTGKTSLVVHAAHRLGGPDAVLYADLADAAGRPVPPTEVLGQLMLAFGVEPGTLPDTFAGRLAGFHRLTSHHRGVLVLDDAVDASVVQRLIPPAPGWQVLVTARGPLRGLCRADRTVLGPMPVPDGLGLLAAVAGPDRITREPAEAVRLVELCGGLPLPLRAVANRLAARPEATLREQVGRLRDERHRLDRIRAGDLDVRTAIDDAYRRLAPQVRTAVRRLAALPGSDHDERLLPVLADPPGGTEVVVAAYESGLVRRGPLAGRVRVDALVALHARTTSGPARA